VYGKAGKSGEFSGCVYYSKYKQAIDRSKNKEEKKAKGIL
jgi:hypothetical protein